MNGKRFLVIGLLSLFMISMFAGVAVAQDLDPLAGLEGSSGGEYSSISDKIYGLFSDVGGSGVATFGNDIEGRANFSRIFLIILVALLVYAVTSNLPFLKGEDKNWIRGGVAIIVAILSFMFVSVEDVAIILSNYEALGIALTSIIPLAVMVAFFLEMRKEDSVWGTVISRPAFILFGLYSVYRWATYRGPSNLIWMYAATAIISFVWVVIEKRAWKYFSKGVKESKKRKFEKVLETAADVDIAKARQHEKYAGADTGALD